MDEIRTDKKQNDIGGQYQIIFTEKDEKNYKKLLKNIVKATKNEPNAKQYANELSRVNTSPFRSFNNKGAVMTKEKLAERTDYLATRVLAAGKVLNMLADTVIEERKTEKFAGYKKLFDELAALQQKLFSDGGTLDELGFRTTIEYDDMEPIPELDELLAEKQKVVSEAEENPVNRDLSNGGGEAEYVEIDDDDRSVCRIGIATADDGGIVPPDWVISDKNPDIFPDFEKIAANKEPENIEIDDAYAYFYDIKNTHDDEHQVNEANAESRKDLNNNKPAEDIKTDPHKAIDELTEEKAIAYSEANMSDGQQMLAANAVFTQNRLAHAMLDGTAKNDPKRMEQLVAAATLAAMRFHQYTDGGFVFNMKRDKKLFNKENIEKSIGKLIESGMAKAITEKIESGNIKPIDMVDNGQQFLTKAVEEHLAAKFNEDELARNKPAKQQEQKQNKKSAGGFGVGGR